ncbi:MAG: hypothetical protein GC149_01420 [Gammaproteobacteria bacterium]|nr:hypothetical protein [Gammaproteobacteria bacterium]
MLSASEMQTLRTKLEEYEGNIPHMYLDAKGLVTVGIGYLLANAVEAQKLPFVNNTTGKAATAAEIKTDYDNVKKQSKGFLAGFYKKFTKLKLTPNEIDLLTNKTINQFYGELKTVYPDYDSYPGEVKLALFDMIYNLGMSGLSNNWPNFNKYIKAKDWKNAAAESKRKPPVSPDRNKYVKDLLEQAAKLTTPPKP